MRTHTRTSREGVADSQVKVIPTLPHAHVRYVKSPSVLELLLSHGVEWKILIRKLVKSERDSTPAGQYSYLQEGFCPSSRLRLTMEPGTPTPAAGRDRRDGQSRGWTALGIEPGFLCSTNLPSYRLRHQDRRAEFSLDTHP